MEKLRRVTADIKANVDSVGIEHEARITSGYLHKFYSDKNGYIMALIEKDDGSMCREHARDIKFDLPMSELK